MTMTKETVKAFYLGDTNRIIVTDSNDNSLINVQLGDDVKIREDIDELRTLDGFHLYDGMKRELKSNGFASRITDIDIDGDNGFITIGLNDSGYAYPITVLEVLQNYECADADYMTLRYEDVEIQDVNVGDTLRVKPNVVIGKEYGLFSNVRYLPDQFYQLAEEYESHTFALPGEFVTVVHVDNSDGTVYCADEENGIALWYGVEMLQKPLEETNTPSQEAADELIAFIEALRAASEMAGIEIPQAEEESILDLDDDDLEEVWAFDDNEQDETMKEYLDDSWMFDDRYEAPCQRLDSSRMLFCEALDYLKIEHEHRSEGSIWYMTNGERALTFKDDRLVDVRLSEHIDNFVYFSAPIQVKDLDDLWEIKEVVDEETEKINEIVAIAESLKDTNLMLDLLYIIGKYTE